jgi:hypothetical protein
MNDFKYKIDQLNKKYMLEIHELKKSCLLELLDKITKDQYDFFFNIYKTFDDAYENHFDSAIGLLERTVKENDKDGVTMMVVRDKIIDKIINIDVL